MSDLFLFAAFPYAAFLVAVGAGVYRYFIDRFSYTSGSSQFLENRWLFWGAVSWHYGILTILAAHLLAVLFPGAFRVLLGDPARLFLLEATGLALGFLSLFGIGTLIVRRLLHPRLQVVMTAVEWVLLAVLFLQVASGVYVAWGYRWGGAWYLHTAVPWLRSLARLSPEVAYVAPLPGIVKLHIVNAFVIVALLPFTRLVHLFTVPLGYLWRPYILFLWNRREAGPAGGGR